MTIDDPITVLDDFAEFRCPNGECPWPTDAAIHVPWCSAIEGHVCGGGVLGKAGLSTHQHRPKKGMGGNNAESKIVAVICQMMHMAVDNSDLCDSRRYTDSVSGNKYNIYVSESGRQRPVLSRNIPEGSDGRIGGDDSGMARVLRGGGDRVAGRVLGIDKDHGMVREGHQETADVGESSEGAGAEAILCDATGQHVASPPALAPDVLLNVGGTPEDGGAGDSVLPPDSAATKGDADVPRAPMDLQRRQRARNDSKDAGQLPENVLHKGVLVPVRDDGDGSDLPRRGTTDGDSPDSPEELITADWTAYSEDELVQEFDEGGEQMYGGLLRRCHAVHQHHEHSRDWKQTSEVFAISKRTAEGLGGFWIAYLDVSSDVSAAMLVEQLPVVAESKDLVQMVGRKAKNTRGAALRGLLEALVAHRTTYGETPSPAKLAHDVAVEAGTRKNVERYTLAQLAELFLAFPGRTKYRNALGQGFSAFVAWLVERETA